MEQRKNGLGIASMIIGIISLLLSCCYGGFLGIVGLILGIIAMTKSDSKKGTAIAGIITSGIAVLMSVILLIAGVSATDLLNDTSSTATSDTITTTEADNYTTEATKIETTEDLAENTTEENTTEEQTEEQSDEQTEELTEEPLLSEEEFRNSCTELSYKDILRNPDDYIGNNVVVTVKVAQTGISGSFFDTNEYMRAYSNDEYDWWMGDTYVLIDKRTTDTTKILQDDIITVYGTFVGTQEFTLALTGTSEEYPVFEIKYMDLIGE